MKMDENILQLMLYFEVALSALDPHHLTIQMLRQPVVKLLILYTSKCTKLINISTCNISVTSQHVVHLEVFQLQLSPVQEQHTRANLWGTAVPPELLFTVMPVNDGCFAFVCR